ncbi:MAG: CHAT domain-containing protein [Hyphomonadaceae bacterium]|nr:CHAT domain-containing protein [Hyphomonadaceae bacterium]
MASKWKWLAGVTLAIGALTHGGMASAQSIENACGDEGRAAPLRPPQLLTPGDVKSAAEYAYAQNRRLVFREAADAYQDLATVSDDALVTPEQRFESALFNAVNLSNQDRSVEAEQRIAALKRLFEPAPTGGNDAEWAAYAGLRADPFSEAQLTFFSGLVAAQQGDYAGAIERLDALDKRLNSLGLADTVDAIRLDNGDVQITSVGALRMSRSNSDARSSRAFGSILGQRAMTAVEKTAILKTHAHYLRSIIRQQLAGDAADDATRRRESALADEEIRKATEAASVFGVQYAPWLRAKVASRAAVLRMDAGDEGGAKRIAEQALAIYTAYGNGGPLEAELRRVLASIYVKEGNRNAALTQERAAFCVRAAGADLAPIDTAEVLPMLDLLLAGQPSTDDRAVTAEFFRVAAAAMEGDTARVVSQSANLMSQRAEQQPEIREAILAEIDLAKLKERLAGLQNEGRSAGDQDVRIARQQIAATTARLQAIYSRGVPENLSRESAAGRAKAAGFLPAQAALADAANADLAALQAVLAPGELYVRFLLTDEAGFGVAISSTRARAFRIADTPGLLTRLQTIQEGVLYGLRRDRPERMLDVLDEAAAAYGDLFGPIDDMTTESRRLILDATGAAANIPFSLLVARAMTAEEMAGVSARVQASYGRDFTGVPWLGRDRSISMVASAVSFKAQREDTAGSSAPNPILAFASPPLPNEAARPQLATEVTQLMQQNRPRYRRPDCAAELEEIYAYPGLEGSYESALSASRLMAGGAGTGYRIVSGQDFTDQNIRNFARFSEATGQPADLDDYRVLYFGSHGQHPGANKCVQEALLVTTTPAPDQAAASPPAGDDALGDGMLDTSEIQRLSLNADLVVLAACETVGMRRIKEGAGLSSEEAARLTRLTGLSGGGVIGNFAGSFFVAGARSVLATYWAVENEATNRFMNAFFETAAGGAARADAVQAAQRRLMDDPEYSNPIFWAPFVFIGDGSKTLKVGAGAAPPA